MYHERLRLLSLHLIRCLYSSRVRKPVMGKLQKGETGRAPGPSEVLSKAFPFYALSRRYSSCQLIFILAKTWGLKRTFQLLRHTLQQDWVFFSFFEKTGRGSGKKREKTWNSRNGKDFQTERHRKKSVGETGQGWIWHCAPLKRGTRHIQDVLILASRFVCSSRKSIWHITINMYWGILYILSQVCPALRAKINEADREKVPCEYVCVVCSAAAAHQLTAFLLSTVVPRWDLKRKKFNKVWSPFISSQASVGAFHNFLRDNFFPRYHRLFCLVYAASLKRKLTSSPALWSLTKMNAKLSNSFFLSLNSKMNKWCSSL